MNNLLIGWDIGGAHLKAAVLNEQAEVVNVIQKPCPLWLGIAELEQALQRVLQRVDAPVAKHVITMTGELADCFASREQGVQAIIAVMQANLPDAELWIYAGSLGFLPIAQVQLSHTLYIASMNWMASAAWVAKHIQTGLFVDIGSTTTDILLIENHAVQAQGLNDYQRLVSGELFYTGIIRTSVMAITQRAVFKGQDMGLMAEHFATMADVYRLSSDLNAAHDQAATADGGEKTLEASALRLSRLTGYEYEQADYPLWLEFAEYLKQQQKHLIRLAVLRQIARCADKDDLVMVGAGVGRFLLKEMAVELGMAYQDFNDFCKINPVIADMQAADCAPAVAVASLFLIL